MANDVFGDRKLPEQAFKAPVDIDGTLLVVGDAVESTDLLCVEKRAGVVEKIGQGTGFGPNVITVRETDGHLGSSAAFLWRRRA